MTADSRGEGQGSTFSVYLPLREAEQHVPPSVPAERRSRATTLDLDGTHVLIVDDEQDARELLRVMLANTNARISEADSAAEALRIYSEDRPDIILADIAMPGQDGYALLRTIRSLPHGEGGHARAIAVSAYARREDRQRALKAGFNDHVCKPVQPGDLYDALERVWVQSARPLLSDPSPDAKVH
jgi:CheY-like chemotaxis protein